MPVLLSLQSLGVSPGDVHISATTKIFMQVWRFVVWSTFLAYSGIVFHDLMISNKRSVNSFEDSLGRLETADMIMVFVAAVTANLLHNFQKVSFLKIVHNLNDMGTRSQIKPQSDFDGSRCFLISLMNMLCHITCTVIYLVYEGPRKGPLDCAESAIRMLFLSTTLLLQVRCS